MGVSDYEDILNIICSCREGGMMWSWEAMSGCEGAPSICISREEGTKPVNNHGRNTCLIIQSLSSELTCRDKKAAQEQQICHDEVLLMCVETIILMSIARTELVGHAHLLLFTALHACFFEGFSFLSLFESDFSLLFMLAISLVLEGNQMSAEFISKTRAQKCCMCCCCRDLIFLKTM